MESLRVCYLESLELRRICYQNRYAPFVNYCITLLNVLSEYITWFLEIFLIREVIISNFKKACYNLLIHLNNFVITLVNNGTS